MKGNSQQINFNDSGSLTKIYAGSTIDIEWITKLVAKGQFF